MRENQPNGRNGSGKEPEKQDISQRTGQVYIPSESHQKKVENFRLNITEEIPAGDDVFEDSKEVYSHAPAAPVRPVKTEDNVIHSHSTGPVEPTRPPVALKSRTEKPMPLTKEQKKINKKRSKQKGTKNRWLYRCVWLAMILLVSIASIQYLVAGLGDMLAMNRKNTTVSVHLEKDATTAEIADILEENGLIENKSFFQMYSKLTKADGHYEYGNFDLNTSMDYEALINRLQSTGTRADTLTVTFPEGMSIRDIAKKMQQEGVCDEEEILKAANDYSLFKKYELIAAIDNRAERYYLLEGYLFPNTYNFYRSEKPEVALGKMLNNCQQQLTDKIRDQAENKNMTLDEVLTMASMIQKEAKDTQDMYVISSVFHNRLKKGSSSSVATLDSDPTVWYPYANRADVPASELTNGFSSRYDTYKIKGLPPGPICSPGIDAIEAALNPEKTSYLYFCHAKDGTPYYAKTLNEHKQNLVKAGLAES